MSVVVVRRGVADTLSNELYFNRLHGFLSGRVRDESLRALLSRREEVFGLWRQMHPLVTGSSEYQEAVFLTYSFCVSARGGDPRTQLLELLAQPDSQYRAKCYFEDSGVFRFSEFDL